MTLYTLHLSKIRKTRAPLPLLIRSVLHRKIKNNAVVLLLFTSLIFANYTFCQTTSGINSSKADSVKPPKIDTARKEFYLKGGATITNRGISYIPNFSLGKPAIIFDLSMGNGKLFFDPQLRFSIKGEPWTFLFPVRYKIKAAGKFQMTAGVIPLLSFKSVTYMVNGIPTTELVNRRYIGGDFRPNYFFTKNISVGAYYMYFRGVSHSALKNTNFISVNASFSSIKLGWGFSAKLNLQCYYLNQDKLEGFYCNPVLTLLKKNFPFSIQTIMNATIHTDIPSTEKFIWNVSLIYSYNKTYTRK